MIDSEFIIRYTNGLYSAPEHSRPRYEEFRDMFSRGQLSSKQVLVEMLGLHCPDLVEKTILVVASWFGTLGFMLNKRYPDSYIKLLDIDPRCEQFITQIAADTSQVTAVTCDLYGHSYIEDVIINTSCEHIADIGAWLQLIPSGKIVVLQSNNFYNCDGHINCVSSIDQFIAQVDLSKILGVNELVMPMYTRYTIIGITK